MVRKNINTYYFFFKNLQNNLILDFTSKNLKNNRKNLINILFNLNNYKSTVHYNIKTSPKIVTKDPIFFSNNWYERECVEFNNLKIIGSRDNRNLLLPYKSTYKKKKQMKLYKKSHFNKVIISFNKNTINL